MSPIRLALKEARDAAGLSQAELAARVGVRQATISDLETGKSQRIELGLLDRLGRALEVEAASLIVTMPSRRTRRRT